MSSLRGLPLLGLFLPVLGGGNVFDLLEPEPALAMLFSVVAGVALLWTIGRSREDSASHVASAALFVLGVVWVLNLELRESGPRAAIDTQAFLAASLLFVVFRTRPLETAELTTLVATLTVGTLLTVAYGQYQYWVAFPQIEPIIRAAGHTPILSVNANFYNANCYAPFLAAIAILIVPLLFRTTLWTRALAVVALPPILATLVLTGSRATMALLFTAGALVLARRSGIRVRASAAWAVGAAVLVAVATIARLSELVQVGILGRWRIWRASLRMIADHWALGVGLGGFGAVFSRYRLDDYYTRYPHNLGLQVFAELGVVAALALFTFLALAGYEASKSLRSEGSDLHAAAALASLLLIAHALVDIDWQAPANPMLLFMLLAVAASGARSLPRNV